MADQLGCQYCRISTAGDHEITCPLYAGPPTIYPTVCPAVYVGDMQNRRTMTDQQLSDWLAEWMGWHHDWAHGCWRDNTNTHMFRTHHWRPTEDLNQAMMLVEKLIEQGWEFRLYSHFRNYYAGFWKEGGIEQAAKEHHGLNPARAICLAIYEAMKGVVGE